MKYAKIDAPIAHIQQVKLNGEMITIPSTYDCIRIRGDFDDLQVYLCSYEHDYEWLLADVELDSAEAIDGGIRYEHDIYDGYDVDAAIEYVLEHAKA